LLSIAPQQEVSKVKRSHSFSSSNGSNDETHTRTQKRKKQKCGNNFSLHLTASAFSEPFNGRVKALSELKLRVRPRFVGSAPWEQEFLITSHILKKTDAMSAATPEEKGGKTKSGAKDATLRFSLHWVAPEEGVGSHGHICVSVERQASKKNAFMPMILHVMDVFPSLFEKSLMGEDIRKDLVKWLEVQGNK